MKFVAGMLAGLGAFRGGASTDAFVSKTQTVAGRASSHASSCLASTLASVQEVTTTPVPGMKPGTSGLRKKVQVWQGLDTSDEHNSEYYVENFIQSLLDTATAKNGGEVPST